MPLRGVGRPRSSAQLRLPHSDGLWRLFLAWPAPLVVHTWPRPPGPEVFEGSTALPSFLRHSGVGSEGLRVALSLSGDGAKAIR